jgi:polyisoprenyl-phosphate glycosyltransferase
MAGTQILSIICVLDGRQREPVPVLGEVHRFAAAMSMPFELVIVLNGLTPRVAEEVRSLARTLDSLQLYFMKRRVDYPTALLAGLENAIGDWVATIDPACDDPAVLRDLVQAALGEHCEVAVASPMGRLRRMPVEALLSTTFHFVFRRLHGFSLALESPTARLISRAVVNDVLQHDSPLIALETLTAAGGYSRVSVPATQSSPLRLPVAERLKVRWRTLLGINAAPLRIANLICAAGALAALAYSIYVLAIYLFKSNVMPGWTTVSLILSAMFLTFSLVLGMLSEYLILLLDVGARRGRYEIVEELASTVQPRSKLLNVETQL